MERREFIAAGIALAGVPAQSVSAAEDGAAIQQLIKDCYSIFYTDRDKVRYRALLTDDYLLLEKGEILNADRDVALMPAPGSDYKRTDTFDFRRVTVHDDRGYVVYIVTSEIDNKRKVPPQHVVDRFLESAIVRRVGTRWRIELIHSTQIPKPG